MTYYTSVQNLGEIVLELSFMGTRNTKMRTVQIPIQRVFLIIGDDDDDARYIVVVLFGKWDGESKLGPDNQ